MPSLRKLVEEQLKKNVPLSEIRRELKERGYDIEEVNKAVRDTISNVDRRLPNITIVQIGVLVIGIAIAVGVIVYLVNNSVTTTSFCEKFRDFKYAISCDDAVDLALTRSPGTVENVSIGSVQILDFSNIIPPNLPSTYIKKDVWFIDVKFTNPYFDDDLKKEVNYLRVGIGLNEDIGVFKEVLM